MVNAMRTNRTISARVIFVCALALLLAACSPAEPTRRDITQPAANQQAAQRLTSQPATYLRPGVWRVGWARAILTSAFPANHIPPFDKTSTSAAKAQRLYNALLALPVMPAGPYYCPIDFGTLYHLSFYDDATHVAATAIVEPGGCGDVTLPDGAHRWTATTPSFWPTFAAAFNVPESAIWPQPHQSGPSAPATLPN